METKFRKTMWCAGKEIHLVKIYDEKTTPDWNNLIPQRDNPIFIHKGQYHGLYQPSNTNKDLEIGN